MADVLPMRAAALSERAMVALLELYSDNPARFEQLCDLLSRRERPTFGSVVVNFEQGKIARLEKNESIK